MRGLGQSLLVALIASVVGAVFLEVSGALIYRFARGETFSRAALQARLLADRFDAETEEEAAQDDAAVPDQPVVLHPFFGFVINPAGRGVNDFGFFRDDPLIRRSSDKRSILFTGGSVSDQVFQFGQEALRDELRERPDFRGRRIEILTTAVGGYKQPQQMMILAYLLARGAEFDVVINLDGFNEIDSSMDNLMNGVNPFFPHTWKLHARLGLDTRASAELGRIAMLREERARLRRLFARPLLRSSAFALVLWDFLDRAREARIRATTAQLESMLDEENPPPQVAGPPYEHESDEQFFTEMADFWARSSRQMARLCEDHGIAYVHALQPNQYLPGSKVLTEEELDVAYDEAFPGMERVPVAYPLLIERGRILRQEHGVNFVDLTQIFAGDSRTLYIDFCCHVNPLGAEQMARAIAAAIPALRD